MRHGTGGSGMDALLSLSRYRGMAPGIAEAARAWPRGCHGCKGAWRPRQPLLSRGCAGNIIESWNALGWKGYQRSSSSIRCHGWGHVPPDQVTQSPIQRGLGHFQGRGERCQGLLLKRALVKSGSLWFYFLSAKSHTSTKGQLVPLVNSLEDSRG